MSEANKSLMLSEAEIIEAINSDSLISVSLGAGQPQKNVKMSTLATVAAGINLSAKSYPFMSRGTLYSQSASNGDLEDGIYHIANWDSPINYGMMIQFSTQGMVTQIVFAFQNRGLWFRSNWNKEGWFEYIPLL